MRLFFYITPLLLLFFSLQGQATEGETSFQAVKAPSSLLLDIVAMGPESAVAVGERGHLLTLEGTQWQQHALPTRSTLTKATYSGGSIWAVGHDASIIRGNKEQEWSLVYQDKANQKPLFDLHFFDELHGIAVGAYGLFLRTTDGGAHWLPELHASLLLPDDIDYLNEIRQESEDDYRYELEGILPHLNQLIATKHGRLVMVGEMGLIAVSDDLGKSWQRLDEIYHGSFFTVLESSQGRLFAGGLRGNLYYSDDGAHWHQSRTHSQANINGLVELGNGKIVALCNNATWLVSDDAGVTFDVRQLDDASVALAAVERNHQLLVVGDNGIQPLQP